jgi:hypothetical protein
VSAILFSFLSVRFVQSIVVELKCAEIVDSTIFTAGVTCRFPRISRIRYDKPVSDIMTIEEMVDLKIRLRQQSGINASKANGGSASLESDEVGLTPSQDSIEEGAGGVYRRGRGRRGGKAVHADDLYAQANSAGGDMMGQEGRRGLKRAVVNTVDSRFKVNMEAVQKKGYLFDKMVFCILDEEFRYSDTQIYTKDEVTLWLTRRICFFIQLKCMQLTKAIRSQNGVVIANVKPEVIVVAGSKRCAFFPILCSVCYNPLRRTFSVKEHIKRGENDVVDFKYIVECVRMGEKLPLNYGLERQILRDCDCYNRECWLYRWLLGCSRETEMRWLGQIDICGDQYVQSLLLICQYAVTVARWYCLATLKN